MLARSTLSLFQPVATLLVKGMWPWRMWIRWTQKLCQSRCIEKRIRLLSKKAYFQTSLLERGLAPIRQFM